MKKRRFFKLMVIVLLLVIVSTSCKKNVSSVTLDKTTLTLVEGKSETLTATVEPDKAENKSITWSSNNPAVATVINGIVNAISEGTAIITATTEDNNKTATCNVTVIPPSIDLVTEKEMNLLLSTEGEVKFEFAGTGTIIIDWDYGRDIDTFTLSSKPLICERENAYYITITGKNVSYLNIGGDGHVIYLDVSGNTALTELICRERIALRGLDVSKNIHLKKLDCYRSNLTNLDVSKNTALTELYCGNNDLTSLDISNNTKLTHLVCCDNRLSSLDLSKNTKLKILSCGDDSRSLDLIPLLESLHTNSIAGKTVYYTSFIPIGDEIPTNDPHWDIARNKGWNVEWGIYNY